MFHIAGSLCLLLLIILVCGALLFHQLGIRTRFWADSVIAIFALGVSSIGLLVYVLILANAYYVWVLAAALLTLLFRGLLLYQKGSWICLKPKVLAWNAGLDLGPLDKVVAAICALLIASSFSDAITSPMTSWDAVVSWDKWATEWAASNSMADRLLGYYPQLMPMVSSVIYKLTGTQNDPISLTQYALHALQPLLAAILLLAILRLCSLSSVSAWPALLVVFGLASMRTHVQLGSADLFSTTMAAVAVAMLYAAMQGHIESSSGLKVFFGLLLFAAFFSKLNNLAILIAYAMAGTLSTLTSTDTDSVPGGTVQRNLLREISVAALLACGAVGTFIIHQYVNSSLPPARMQLSQLNFNPADMARVLSDTSATSVGNRNGFDKLLFTATEVSLEYGLPSPKILLLLIFFSFLASLPVKASRPLLATALVQIGLWYSMSVYDRRNLLPALPLAGVCIGIGLRSLYGWMGRVPVTKVLLLVPLLIFCPLMLASVSLSSSNALIALVAQLPERIRAINSGFEARATLFYPDEIASYRFSQAISAFRNAELIMAGTRMYRWLPNGGYPLSYWAGEKLRPGDGYVALGGMMPPFVDRWTLVYDDSIQRMYLLDREPTRLASRDLLFTGNTPPRFVQDRGAVFDIETTGSEGYVAYNLPIRDLRRGACITWRVVVAANKSSGDSLMADYLSYDPAIVDHGLSRVFADRSKANDGIIVYSGIVVFTGTPMSSNVPVDGILVGLATRTPGARCEIREFRVSLYR